jgi:hypothetical protein
MSAPGTWWEAPTTEERGYVRCRGELGGGRARRERERVAPGGRGRFEVAAMATPASERPQPLEAAKGRGAAAPSYSYLSLYTYIYFLNNLGSMPHPHRARRFPGPCLALESSALLTPPPPLFLSIHILLSFRGPEPRQNGRTDMLGSSAAASLCHPFSPHVQQDAGRWDQSTEDPAGDATMGGRLWGVAATRRRQPPKSLEHNPQFLLPRIQPFNCAPLALVRVPLPLALCSSLQLASSI